jgi:hypothetical protein
MSLPRATFAVVALAAVSAATPLPARAQAAAPSGQPSGLTATFSLAGGGELGLEEGAEAGLGEVEVTAGWEIGERGLRPELAFAAGFGPESTVAIRGGMRFDLPRLPLALRVAVDASNARGDDLRWRWLLVGLVAEVRFTSLLGLYAEVDSGAPLNRDAGVPLLARAGASFRF